MTTMVWAEVDSQQVVSGLRMMCVCMYVCRQRGLDQIETQRRRGRGGSRPLHTNMHTCIRNTNIRGVSLCRALDEGRGTGPRWTGLDADALLHALARYGRAGWESWARSGAHAHERPVGDVYTARHRGTALLLLLLAGGGARRLHFGDCAVGARAVAASGVDYVDIYLCVSSIPDMCI